MNPDHELNRAAWEVLAEIHGQDAYYDSAALVAGSSSLIEEEEIALTSALRRRFSEKRVLHLQGNCWCTLWEDDRLREFLGSGRWRLIAASQASKDDYDDH